MTPWNGVVVTSAYTRQERLRSEACTETSSRVSHYVPGLRFGLSGGKPEEGWKKFLGSSPRADARLQFDDATPGGDCYRLRAIVGAEFVHDMPDMGLDGLLRDEQPRTDIPIPTARCDLL
jgi:hypothetical protein